MKVIFLEGLPGVGKTTIINRIRDMNIKNVHVVDEIIETGDLSLQSFYMNNDLKKYNMYKEGIIIIDRGPISTLSYNECKRLISDNKDLPVVQEWFEKTFKNIYLKDNVQTIYLKSKNNHYLLRYEDDKDSYGSIENLKLLEGITINNIKKFCNSYRFLNMDEYGIEEVINEIIN